MKTHDYMYSSVIVLLKNDLQVVGRGYDNAELDDTDGGDKNTERVYETVYALLDNLSPSYQTTFNSAVSDKLNKHCNNTAES